MHFAALSKPTADADEAASDNNPVIDESHLQEMTISMLKFYEQQKGSLSFHNNISSATSPYEVTEKIWKILDVNEVGTWFDRAVCLRPHPINLCIGS